MTSPPLSQDNTLIVTGSSDKNIKIWGLDFGDCHRSLFAHDNSIMALQVGGSPHPLILTSSSSHSSSSHPHPHILILTSTSSHPHPHILILTPSSSHPHPLILTSTSSHSSCSHPHPHTPHPHSPLSPSTPTHHIQTCNGHVSSQFVPKTHMVFTASKDRTVKCWDVDSFEHVMTLEVRTVLTLHQHMKCTHIHVDTYTRTRTHTHPHTPPTHVITNSGTSRRGLDFSG